MTDWIKCSEQMPEKDTMVIVACYGSDIVIPLTGETVWETFDRQNREIKRVTMGFIGSDGWYGADGFPLMIVPTYWQHLPEAPAYEHDPDDVDTGMTWEEMHNKPKKKHSKPLTRAKDTIIGTDGIERTRREVFEVIFNDSEGEE